MSSLTQLLSLAHVVGLALAVGGATAKLTLLLRCRGDHRFAPTYVAVARPLTRLLLAGLGLLTLSGIGWLLSGYPFSPTLVVKLVLVAAVWVIGPIIDKVAEPRFVAAVPAAGEPATPGFVRALRDYLLLELVATGLFYVITVMWVLV